MTLTVPGLKSVESCYRRKILMRGSVVSLPCAFGESDPGNLMEIDSEDLLHKCPLWYRLLLIDFQ